MLIGDKCVLVTLFYVKCANILHIYKNTNDAIAVEVP